MPGPTHSEQSAQYHIEVASEDLSRIVVPMSLIFTYNVHSNIKQSQNKVKKKKPNTWKVAGKLSSPIHNLKGGVVIIILVS